MVLDRDGVKPLPLALLSFDELAVDDDGDESCWSQRSASDSLDDDGTEPLSM